MKTARSVLTFSFISAAIAMSYALLAPAEAVGRDSTGVASEGGNTILCNSDGYCEIPYEKPTNQASDPFLFLEKIVDGSHPRFSYYKKPIGKHPDTVSCLTKTEQGFQVPNLLQIDWPNLRNQRDIEVCLFRVFGSLGNQDAIRAWLEYHAFEVWPGEAGWRKRCALIRARADFQN